MIPGINKQFVIRPIVEPSQVNIRTCHLNVLTLTDTLLRLRAIHCETLTPTGDNGLRLRNVEASILTDTGDNGFRLRNIYAESLMVIGDP